MGGIQNILESGNPIPTINENGQMVDYVTVYAKDPNTTTGLTWGYCGGNWGTFSPATGTLTLTNNAANYIVVSRSTGAVSFSTSTTNWNDNVGFARCYIATTSGGAVTTIEDKRCGPLGILSGADGPPGASGASSSGSGTPFFLDHTAVLAADTDSVGINVLQRTASDDTQELISQAVTAQTLMMGPAFEDGVLGITTIPGGQWSFLMYCYASATSGVNEIKPAIYIKQAQAGTVAITGTGTSRTATVTGGTPFIAGHAHADMEKCSWLRTPNAQLRITAYTSSTEVTVECLSTYVNESGQAYFIDKQLFDVTTGDVENTTVELKAVDSFQQSFACGLTDKIVIRHFAKTDSGSAKTLNLYYGGTQYYSHLLTPIAIKHNDQAGLNEGDYIHLTATEYADVQALESGSTLIKDTDVALTANSDLRTATQKAVKAYVDAAVGGVVSGVMNIAGSTDCSTNPNYPAAEKGDSYYVTVAGKIGGAFGELVDAGDLIVALADNAGGTEVDVGASWFVIEHNLVSSVVAHNDLTGLNVGDYKHLTANEFTYGILNRIVVSKGDSGTSAQVFDVSAGGYQTITTTGNHSFSFSNWPTTGEVAYLHVEWTNGGAFTVTPPTVRWPVAGTVDPLGYTTNLSTYLTHIGKNSLRSAGIDMFIFWSRDGGTTVWGVVL